MPGAEGLDQRDSEQDHRDTCVMNYHLCNFVCEALTMVKKDFMEWLVGEREPRPPAPTVQRIQALPNAIHMPHRVNK